MSSLAALQRSMRAALHEGDVEPLLTRVAGSTLLGSRTPTQQLAVYEGMYFARQIESLAVDFPRLADALGAELFARVAVTHIKRRPSAHPSLAFLGRGLDATLADLGLVDEADVARLEAARNEAFWSTDRDGLDATALGALGESLASAVLVFHPSLRVVVTTRRARLFVEEPAHEQARDVPPGDGNEGENQTENVAVWRRGYAVVHRSLPALETAALARARDGSRVADVVEVFLAESSPEGAAFVAILGWVSHGWIVGSTLPR